MLKTCEMKNDTSCCNSYYYRPNENEEKVVLEGSSDDIRTFMTLVKKIIITVMPLDLIVEQGALPVAKSKTGWSPST